MELIGACTRWYRDVLSVFGSANGASEQLTQGPKGEAMRQRARSMQTAAHRMRGWSKALGVCLILVVFAGLAASANPYPGRYYLSLIHI